MLSAIFDDNERLRHCLLYLGQHKLRSGPLEKGDSMQYHICGNSGCGPTSERGENHGVTSGDTGCGLTPERGEIHGTLSSGGAGCGLTPERGEIHGTIPSSDAGGSLTPERAEILRTLAVV